MGRIETPYVLQKSLDSEMFNKHPNFIIAEKLCCSNSNSICNDLYKMPACKAETIFWNDDLACVWVYDEQVKIWSWIGKGVKLRTLDVNQKVNISSTKIILKFCYEKKNFLLTLTQNILVMCFTCANFPQYLYVLPICRTKV